MIDKKINSPLTSSMGRLFDAVAALLNVRQAVSYEGQAAIELEAMADESVTDAYLFCLCWPTLDPAPMFAELLADLAAHVPPAIISAKFHNGVARLITAVCLKLRQEKNINQVALSGGVFQNQFLLSRTMLQLKNEGFEIYLNQLVPTHDGGIALGQAAIANAQQKEQLCA
jgi:hydrogenase maturation protein HypF